MANEIPVISIVVPLYRCEIYVEELYERLQTVLNRLGEPYEIVFVNDASPLSDWEKVKEITSLDPSVVGVNLSRNFGQHHAITAGLDLAQGDWVAVMDGDLQDQPEELPKLYDKAQSGYHVVLARREHRKDRWSKRLGSYFFHRALSFFTNEQSDPAIANYGLYSRAVVTEIREMREQTRSFPLAVKWLGFQSCEVNVAHASRSVGESSYTYCRLFRLALDIIISRSNKPLHLSIQFGFFLSLSALIAGILLVLKYFFSDVTVPGWTSTMVTLVFIGGLLFANLGLIGIYLGKIYDELKARPLYVISEVINQKRQR